MFCVVCILRTVCIWLTGGFRYRSHEYDTNRDPRGPLTAGAEVLYGIVSGFASGIAEVPSGMRGIFSTTHERRLHHKHDWKKARRPSCLDELNTPRHRHRRTETSLDSGVGADVVPNGDSQHPGTGSQGQYEHGDPREDLSSNEDSRESTESDEAYHSAGEEIHRDQAVSDRQQNVNGATNSPSSGDPSSPPISSSDTDTFDTTDDDMGAELDLERTVTRLRSREMSHTKEILAETSYHSARATKHILNWLLLLPTDLTLSLTKGFHNAPKLYHDTLVEESPRVLGVRSGFRAAGTVCSSDAPEEWLNLLMSIGIHSWILQWHYWTCHAARGRDGKGWWERIIERYW